MKYKSFKITNYKGIEELEISFTEGNLLILSGLNESGKTTVLDAINNWGLMTKKQYLENGKKNALLPKYKPLWTGIIRISAVLDIKSCKADLSFELKSDELEIIFEYSVENGQFTTNEPSCRFQNKGKVVDKDENSLQQILEKTPDILYYDDFCYDVPKEIKFELAATDSMNEPINKMWQSILSDAFLSFKKAKQEHKTEVTFESFVKNFLEEDKKENASNTLSQLSTYISNQIREPWNKKINLAKKSSFKEVRLEYSKQDHIIYFKFKVISENGSNFAVNERSKGFKWFFSFIMLTTFRMSRNSNTLFLLDEPASNLHASVQEEITQLIIELTNECQVIYTTHSPYMLDPLYIKNILLMINEEQDEGAEYPKILIDKAQKFISQSNRDLHMRPILDFLYFSYPRIVPDNDSLFIEGYGDYLHLEFFKLVINYKEPLNLVPFTGAGTMARQINYLKTRSCKIKILLDDDKNGRDAKQNYKNEFCLEEKDIFLHSDINEECKLIEDIYSEKDKQNIFRVAQNGYANQKTQEQNEKNKLKISISKILQNLEKLKEIKLEEETKSKINEIFKKLQNN